MLKVWGRGIMQKIRNATTVAVAGLMFLVAAAPFAHAVFGIRAARTVLAARRAEKMTSPDKAKREVNQPYQRNGMVEKDAQNENIRQAS